MNKAIEYDGINISLLDNNEKVNVLGFLGEKVDNELDPYNILFRTACDIKNKVKPGEQFLDTISVLSDSTTEFPIVKKLTLYIRETYKELYDKLIGFSDTPSEVTQNCIVITGTSGIGKSAFLVYFTIRILAQSKDDNPPIVIFHTKESSKCYAFGGTSTLQVGDISIFEPFLYLPQTWYLVDSSPDPVLNKAKTIIAVSPKTLNSVKRYRDVSKETPMKYFMAPWTLDELEECRQKVFSTSGSEVKKELMEMLYAKIGGVPRYVLQSAATSIANKVDPNHIEDIALEHVRIAIGEVKDPSILLQIVQANESLAYSSCLLHHWPNVDHTASHLKWASTYIQLQIQKRV